MLEQEVQDQARLRNGEVLTFIMQNLVCYHVRVLRKFLEEEDVIRRIPRKYRLEKSRRKRKNNILERVVQHTSPCNKCVRYRSLTGWELD